MDRFVLLEMRNGDRRIPKPSGTDVVMTGDLEEIQQYLTLKTGRASRRQLYSDGGSSSREVKYGGK